MGRFKGKVLGSYEYIQCPMSRGKISVYISKVLSRIIYQVGRIPAHRSEAVCIYHGFYLKWEDPRAYNWGLMYISRSLYQVGRFRGMVLGSYAYI